MNFYLFYTDEVSSNLRGGNILAFAADEYVILFFLILCNLDLKKKDIDINEKYSISDILCN